MTASLLQRLSDVTIVPVTSVHQHIPHGGPLWPGFANAAGLRHCRAGVPVDQPPDPPSGPVAELREPAVWGGFLDAHFGHLVAEHLPRLPFALRDRPDHPVLFTLDPVLDPGALPGWIWGVLDWIGVPRARVRLVTQAVRVADLSAGPQAEMLPQVPPSAAYLDLLDARAADLRPVACDLVYVGRAGLAAKGGGGTAGEGYLIALLTRLGVTVLDPGRADVATQLATYAGARHLVFAEGSALHGRQLLGRVRQQITVLRRRRGRSMARAMLTPRVSGLEYREVTATALIPLWKSGQPRPDPALSVYDLPWLFAAFALRDVDLPGFWDMDAYHAAVQADLAGWFAHRQPEPPLVIRFRRQLAEAGLPEAILPAAILPPTPSSSAT